MVIDKGVFPTLEDQSALTLVPELIARLKYIADHKNCDAQFFARSILAKLETPTP